MVEPTMVKLTTIEPMAEPVTNGQIAANECFLNIRDGKDRDEEASSRIRTGTLFAWFTSKVPPP